MADNSNNVAYMKTYLKYAVEFERNLYVWENAMQSANARMQQLWERQSACEQTLVSVQQQRERLENRFTYRQDRETTQANRYHSKAKKAFSAVIVILILCAIVAVVLAIAAPGEPAMSILVAISTIFLGFFMLCPIPLIIGIANYSKYKSTQDSNAAVFSPDSQRRQMTLLDDQHQRCVQAQEEIREEENYLQGRQDEIFDALQNARKNRNTLYAENVLDERYRSFTAVATMYGYLESGRCTSIKGHGGIYDTYENELRQNLIIRNLQEINARLSEIAANQRILVQEVRQANAVLSKISDDLTDIRQTNAEIAKNSAITAEATRQIAATTQYWSWRAWASGY